VASNDGAPGVDGITIANVRDSNGGVEGFLSGIHEALKCKRYKPQTVRRAYIPKAGGKQRPLGIPTVRDRVVQMAAKLVLEPIFEADFLDVSYGYRPKRSALEAVQAIHTGLARGKDAIYDADLKGFFDSIPHDKLMACVEMRVSDGSVLKLIRQWLCAPILELDYLSYSFSYLPDRFGRKRQYLSYYPSAKSCAEERDVIRDILSPRHCFVPIPDLIKPLNQQLEGWGMYFSKGHSRRALRRMNWFVFNRMVKHLKRRSQRPYRPPEGVSWYSHVHDKLGLVTL